MNPFEGKRVDTGEWVEGYLVIIDNEYRIYTGDKVDKDLEYYVIDKTTVCQNTCLTDTLGNNIFSNDVLQVVTNSETFECYVSMERGCWQLVDTITGNTLYYLYDAVEAEDIQLYVMLKII